MAFQWSPQRIAWYLDADSQSDFHARLAEQIVPFLHPDDTVCDFGCGLGLLDLRLARHVARITCVDVDAAALACLRRRAADEGVENIETVHCGAEDVAGMYDVALLSFFGSPAARMLGCMAHARRALVRVVNADTNGTMRPHRHRLPKETVPDVKAVFEQNRIPYTLLEDIYQFGQPLRTMADARAFVQCNAPDLPGEEADAFLALKLERRGGGAFPLYLPGEKRLGVFVADLRGRITAGGTQINSAP